MRRTRSFALISALGLALCAPALAQSETRPRLHTNQAEIDELLRATELRIDDPLAVFAFVLNSLPDRVKVYPTENYYYFSFAHQGVRYAGNIRLDRTDRDDGKAAFAYFVDRGELQDDRDASFYRVLTGADGVEVAKLERLLYRVSYRGRSVLFELNDLSAVRPPAAALGPDEKFIGPIFDESALRFFLVFNTRLRVFHYVLDETVPVADQFVAARRADRILIGQRTAFAFYRDHKLDRKILIGVFESNGAANNYFDGPFDQLPDNFIEGEELREAILAVEPGLRGKIDRFGVSPGGAERYLIGPYVYYRTEADLQPFHACATSKRVSARLYYACFLHLEAADGSSRARPAALQRAAPGPKGKR
jgi:hypothetical protein